MTLHPVSERTWESLHTDGRLALKQAASRLATEFAGLYGNETIERFLASEVHPEPWRVPYAASRLRAVVS